MKPIVCLLLAAFACTANAQTVWRCGAEGRSYASTPCPGGRALDVTDAPGAEAHGAAHAVVQRERLALAQLSRERRERELDARRQGWGPAGFRMSSEPTASPRPDGHFKAGAKKAKAAKRAPRPA